MLGGIQGTAEAVGHRDCDWGEEANTVRWFWIQLHYTDDEAEEEAWLKKRQDVLYEKWQAGKQSPEEHAEYSRLEERIVQICHDVVMERVGRNDGLRDQVWPELAPRVLRYWKLREKPGEGLTAREKQELESLLEWFGKLQQEALASVSLGAFFFG
jgi:hypothetical protein